ncbi:MAG: hypothetical protein NT157_00460 [Candidatus Micrarchaeota archaeon]|nr:hypothetical protein [Candidatus Micrarchaeota archaeon]
MLGCAQLQSQTQYICADGKTIVASPSLCPAAAPEAPATPTAAAPAITLDTELEMCSGMPEMQQTSLEEMCIMGLAGKHENASLCKRLSYNTKMQCYLVIATVTNDADVCAEAGSDKNNCYQQYASNTGDASVCDKITDVNNKDSCYSNIASQGGDATLCDKIKSVGQKNSCYWSIAMRLQDVTYCNEITDSNQKQNCLQNLQSQSQPAQPIKP